MDGLAAQGQAGCSDAWPGPRRKRRGAGRRKLAEETERAHGPRAGASAPPPAPPSWATSSSTRSTSRSPCHGRSRPCCPSSARTSKAAGSASTTKRTQAKFPLLGLKFKNTSGLHLMQGPITVFEGTNYAGDARILDLQPNEERLISYAIDLGTEVNPVPSPDNGRLRPGQGGQGHHLHDHQDPRDQDLHHQEPQRRRTHRPGRAPCPQRVQADRHGQAGRNGQRLLPLPGQGGSRQDRDADGHRGTHCRPDHRHQQQQRRHHPHLHQPDRSSARRSRTA